ncbi:unnamed protein product [Peniophora sp. CBMAI 1063]|nr:unnamed protein product [Peniophora sp. CBMAI 1063]
MIIRPLAFVLLLLRAASAAPLDKREAQPAMIEYIEPCVPIGGPGHVTPLTDGDSTLSSRHTCPRPLLSRHESPKDSRKILNNSNHVLRDEPSGLYTDNAWIVRGSYREGEHDDSEAGDGPVFDSGIGDHLGPAPVVPDEESEAIDFGADLRVKRHLCNVEDLDC